MAAGFDLTETVLGFGSYGKVVATSNPRVAAKIWHRVEAPLENSFLIEVAALSALKETGAVPRLFGFDSTRSIIYLERFDTTLTQFSTESPLTPEWIRLLLWEIIRCLKLAHARGIMHRDLNPNNILINRNPFRLVITDWGSAALMGSFGNEPGPNQLQTLAYRAPEVLLDQEKYDGKIDLWSLGCIMGALLEQYNRPRETLKPFFEGANPIEQLGAIFELHGTPTAYAELFPARPEIGLKARLNLIEADILGLDLLSGLLELNPRDRLNLIQAGNHPYFAPIRSSPLVPPHRFPTGKRLRYNVTDPIHTLFLNHTRQAGLSHRTGPLACALYDAYLGTLDSHPDSRTRLEIGEVCYCWATRICDFKSTYSRTNIAPEIIKWEHTILAGLQGNLFRLDELPLHWVRRSIRRPKPLPICRGPSSSLELDPEDVLAVTTWSTYKIVTITSQLASALAGTLLKTSKIRVPSLIGYTHYATVTIYPSILFLRKAKE